MCPVLERRQTGSRVAFLSLPDREKRIESVNFLLYTYVQTVSQGAQGERREERGERGNTRATGTDFRET
jgi:hypothetical protein